MHRNRNNITVARLVLNNIINCWAYCIKAFCSRSLEKSSGIHPCYVSVKVLEMSQLSNSILEAVLNSCFTDLWRRMILLFSTM